MVKISGFWIGVLCIVVGILVLGFPDILRWLLGIFLVVIGILAVMRK